jgi:hypothetical protein
MVMNGNGIASSTSTGNSTSLTGINSVQSTPGYRYNRFKVGDRVDADYKGKGKFYSGTITRVNINITDDTGTGTDTSTDTGGTGTGTGTAVGITYDVRYDDGGSEKAKLLDEVRDCSRPHTQAEMQAREDWWRFFQAAMGRTSCLDAIKTFAGTGTGTVTGTSGDGAGGNAESLHASSRSDPARGKVKVRHHTISQTYNRNYAISTSAGLTWAGRAMEALELLLSEVGVPDMSMGMDVDKIAGAGAGAGAGAVPYLPTPTSVALHPKAFALVVKDISRVRRIVG